MKNKEISSPTRSRDKTLQLLYEIEISGIDLKEILQDKQKNIMNNFILEFLEGINKQKDEIDSFLRPFLDRSIEHLDPIERSALRMAIFEIQNKKVEPIIVLNESIRLSKKYGSPGGFKLINAVLDKIIKENLA